MDTRIEEIGTLSASDGQMLLHMWRVEIPAGARPLRRHCHLSFEITMVKAGRGSYTVGERIYPMEPGDMFVFSSNEPHCITQADAEGMTILNLQFEPRLLWGAHADRLTEAHAGFCFSHGKDFENRIEGAANAPIGALFDQLRGEFAEGRAEYALGVRSYLNLLLIQLIRNYGYTHDNIGLSRNQIHAIRRVLEYIDLHLAEEMTLATISERAGISPNYLSSVFHKISGIPLWDYVNSKRIDKACRLLIEEQELTVLAVAMACGFNNTANFNKVFKKMTGITPSEFRCGGYALY